MTTTENKRTAPRRKAAQDDRPSADLAPNARNPYALAEFTVGHPIDWSAVDDRRAALEDVFGMPYSELFDPCHGSPVFLGSRLDDDGVLRAEDVRVPERPAPVRDSERPENRPDFVARVVRDLEPLVGPFDTARVRSLVPTRSGGWQVEIAGPRDGTGVFVDKVFDRGMLDALINLGVFVTGWTPDGAEWSDTGRFYNEAAEYFDPVQGALGDCGLIAALSSVAWTLPYTFAHRSRATGIDNQQFRNEFRFTDPGTGTVDRVEATERIPVWAGTSSPLYAQSSEVSETWPAQMEKAYAKWITGTASDRPDMTSLNGSVWPDVATAVLTGRRPLRTVTAGQTTAAITNLVKSHCVNGRTVDPMTAWTYATAPDGVDYAAADIVANHAYTVLGWVPGPVLRIGLQSGFLSRVSVHIDHVILRNPWGYTEGTSPWVNTVSLRDIGFTRTLDLSVDDGVFAMPFSTFRRFFAAVGVAV
jgi:Calpain family cysteine protease